MPGARGRRPRAKTDDRTLDLLDITRKLRTAPCVPALRDKVRSWRAAGYSGTTETTRRLLAYWFESDHRLVNGERFAYNPAQREATETLVFVWECEKVRTRAALLERYAMDLKDVPLPPVDEFPRYCTKM